MTTRAPGRHRAAVRPKTPLSSLAEAVTVNAGTVGRRSAVLVASSGLVVTMGLPAADAAPVGPSQDVPDAPVAEKPIAQTPVEEPVEAVVVPADATVTLARSAVTSLTPPPPPPPPPVVVEPSADESDAEQSDAESSRDEAPASRSSERETVEAAPSESGGSVLSIAARYVGTPYVYGGTTPSGFDCSGFVQYVYKQLGVSLPRTAAQQSGAGQRVSSSEARPGDIVSFSDGGGVYHNGIYAGDGMLYDSPRSGKSVSKRAIWTSGVFFTRVG